MVVRLILLIGLALFWATATASASESKEPYQIRLVIHVVPHKQLTRIFRERIARELGDGIQAALGELARVEVTESHPLLPTIQQQGLAKALDGYRQRSDWQFYFVLIDFNGTHYRIQTRVHNGLTGHPSPVVRSTRISDREFVARAAAFLLERDFALVGTIESEPEAGRVQVRLKGGELGVDLGRWIKKGEVFRLGEVNGDEPLQWREWAYLQVVEPAKDGLCTCKLYSRYSESNVAGLRVELLGTRPGPLRLRFLQETPKGPGPLKDSLSVQIRRNGFDGEETQRLQFPVSSSRDINTTRLGDKGRFDRLAFLSVLKDDKVRTRVPVPILDESLTVIVVPQLNELENQKLENYRRFRDKVIEATLVLNSQVRKINQETAKPENRSKGIASGREAIQRLQRDYADLITQRETVLRDLQSLPDKDRPSAAEMKALEVRLKNLKEGETELLKHIAELEQIEKEENDPKRREWRQQIERAKSLEKEGELGEAIEIYQKTPPEFDSPEQQNHLASLLKQWEPKSKEHEAARDFIRKKFPTLKTEELLEKIGELDAAVKECIQVEDALTLRHFQRGLEKQLKRIDEELSKLKPETVFEDQKPAEQIKELLPKLEKIDRDARAYLDKLTKPDDEDK